MALIYSDLYPLQTLIDAAYPQGKAKNVVSAGDGTGTPWEAQLINDHFGFQQSLLDEAGIAPSGSPDEVGASQYLDSIKKMIANEATANGLRNWTPLLAEGEGANNREEFVQKSGAQMTMRGGDYDPITGVWLVCGDFEAVNRSVDDGATWRKFTGGMTQSKTVQDLAIGATSSCVMVGEPEGVNSMYRRDSVLSGNWVEITIPGAAGFLYSIVYDTSNGRFVTVGNGDDSDGYAATSDDGTGTAFTDRSAGVPAQFDGSPLHSLAVNNSGIVIAASQGDNTKIAQSPDGGVNWVVSTTTLASGRYYLAYSQALGLFVAVRREDEITNNIHTSIDGLTWTEKFTGSLGFHDDVGGSYGKGIACYGDSIVITGSATSSNLSAVVISTDGGVTWSAPQILDYRDYGSGGGNLIASRANNKLLMVDFSANGYITTRRGPG